jgi:hypothetical protein
VILLVSAMERREECASALQEAMDEPVVVADNLSRATTLMRTEMYTAAVFDEQIWQNEPNEIEMTFTHLGTAIPVEINFGISGPERLVREVRAAVRRRMLEEAAAREAAVQSLRGELNGTLTNLLLNCELALEISGLPARAMERIVSVRGAAQKLRTQLGTSAAASV